MLSKKLAAILFLVSFETNAQDISKQLLSLRLSSIDGSSFSFNELKNNKASVIFFLSPDCPLCQSYTLTIKELEAECSKSGIKLYGIFPGTWYSIKDIESFKTNYKLNINMLLDTNKVLSKLLKATVTPEVVVLNREAKIVYRGRIDNWMYAVGKKRTVITKHELKDALEAIVNNKPVTVSKTEPVGCLIE